MKDGCPFCDYAGPSEIIMSCATSIVIEPLEPCVPGHKLVIPRKHVRHLASDLDVVGTLFRDVAGAMVGLGLKGKVNVIVNDGTVAGQTVKHVHVHLIPRREGDDVQMPWSWQNKG